MGTIDSTGMLILRSDHFNNLVRRRRKIDCMYKLPLFCPKSLSFSKLRRKNRHELSSAGSFSGF